MQHHICPPRFYIYIFMHFQHIITLNYLIRNVFNINSTIMHTAHWYLQAFILMNRLNIQLRPYLLYTSHGRVGINCFCPSTGAVSSKHCCLIEGSRQKNYRPLLERPCCESLESRIDHYVKRGRLEREEGENGGEMVHRGKRSKNSHNSPSLHVSSETPTSKQSTDQKAED